MKVTVIYADYRLRETDINDTGRSDTDVSDTNSDTNGDTSGDTNGDTSGDINGDTDNSDTDVRLACGVGFIRGG